MLRTVVVFIIGLMAGGTLGFFLAAILCAGGEDNE